MQRLTNIGLHGRVEAGDKRRRGEGREEGATSLLILSLNVIDSLSDNE